MRSSGEPGGPDELPIISAADHIDLQWLPKDLWQKRVPAQWRERAPKVGEDRVMWASDYPHADSTWPESRTSIEESFQAVTPAARRRILCDNARALYGL